MKKILSLIIIGLLCLSTFSILAPQVKAQATSSTSDPTDDLYYYQTGSPAGSLTMPYIDIIYAEISQVDSANIRLSIKARQSIPLTNYWQGYNWLLDTGIPAPPYWNPHDSNDITVSYHVGVHWAATGPLAVDITNDMDGTTVYYEDARDYPEEYFSGDTVSVTIPLSLIGNPTSIRWVAGSTDGRASIVGRHDKGPNTGHATLNIASLNLPPSIPTTPSGPTILRRQELAAFTCEVNDPDGDDVSIKVDWGDGSTEIAGPFPSETVVDLTHVWSFSNMFEVKAMATDIHGAESGWSSALEVTVSESERTNWAGYIVESLITPITSVVGTWTVPNFNAPFPSFQGTWVGIGGRGPSSNLLQAGLMVTRLVPLGSEYIRPFWMTVQSGLFKGWWWFDVNPFHVVSPEDDVKVSISEAVTGLWEVRFEDLTKGWSWVNWIRFNPDQTSAEWIHEPGAANSGVASFTPIVFSEARLVINNVEYKMGKIDSSLNTYLTQSNFIRDDEILTSVSPITNYEQFTISYIGLTPIPANTAGVLSLHSSANLHVYDSVSNHLGYNATSGFIDVQIPNSMYFEDEQGIQYAFLSNPDQYRVNLVGQVSGDFHLHISATLSDQITLDRWFNGTIVEGAVYVYTVSISDEVMTVKPDPIADLEYVSHILAPMDAGAYNDLLNQYLKPALSYIVEGNYLYIDDIDDIKKGETAFDMLKEASNKLQNSFLDPETLDPDTTVILVEIQEAIVSIARILANTPLSDIEAAGLTNTDAIKEYGIGMEYLDEAKNQPTHGDQIAMYKEAWKQGVKALEKEWGITSGIARPP